MSDRPLPAGLTVRAATAGDAASVARVHVETWRSTYAGLIPDDVLVGMSERNRAAHWAQALTRWQSREKVLVAVDDADRVVGFGSCGPARGVDQQGTGEVYGLVSLRANIEDAEHNTTRFLIMAREAIIPHPKSGPVMTSFVFRVRNVPAALYKALGGFATNSINMTKLESYMVGGHFFATQFYAEVEGHPEHRGLRLAFEELGFFSHEVRILGVYPQHPYRQHDGEDDEA